MRRVFSIYSDDLLVFDMLPQSIAMKILIIDVGTSGYTGIEKTLRNLNPSPDSWNHLFKAEMILPSHIIRNKPTGNKHTACFQAWLSASFCF